MQLDIFSERLPGGGGGTVTGTLQLGVANIGRMAMDAAAELGKRVREDDNITTGHMVSGVVRNAMAEGRMRYRNRASNFSSAADGSAESAEASAARARMASMLASTSAQASALMAPSGRSRLWW